MMEFAPEIKELERKVSQACAAISRHERRAIRFMKLANDALAASDRTRVQQLDPANRMLADLIELSQAVE